MVAVTANPTPNPPKPYVDPAYEGLAPSSRPDVDLTFDDFIDIINPLHHIPILSTLYRAITGDAITPHARAVGAGLYGGPAGVIGAGAAMAVEEAVGVSADRALASMLGVEEEVSELAAAPAAPEAAPEAAAGIAPPGPADAAAAAPEPLAAAPPMPERQPFSINRPSRFFALPDRPAGQPAPQLAAAAAAAPEPEAKPVDGRIRLNPAQAQLLDRFIAGASPSGGQSKLPTPPDGATAEWFALQMQANLQKYADAQRAAEQNLPPR